MPTSGVLRLSSGSFECLGSSRCEGCQNSSESGDKNKHYWFRSGASFEGLVENYQKTGHGIFTWPNGARYEGEYSENQRNGKGTQMWPDGSQYCGDFVKDLRHGTGEHYWYNGEKYHGSFFHDRRHGFGTYSWPNGSSFSGTFYMDRREGYGKFMFENGDVFEGLYKEDQRLGPGVMTYSDGRQDVGLWHGQKIIKLCTAIEGAFSITEHPEFGFKAEEHEIFLDDLKSLDNSLESIFDSSEENNETSEKLVHFFNDTLDSRSFAVNHDAFNREFFKDNCNNNNTGNHGNNMQHERIKVKNKTPFLIEIQKHVLKHKFRQSSASFDVDSVVNGDRTRFKGKGPLELASERLLIACINGERSLAVDLLDKEHVHVNVSDKNGHTALIGAAVNWHMSIINTLLDYGADVNQLNDEGCSPLSALCVFYYPVSSFHYNIAERYLKKPATPAKDGLENVHEYGDVIPSESVSTEIILADWKDPTGVNSTTCESKASMDSGFPASGKQSHVSGDLTKPSPRHQRSGEPNINTIHNLFKGSRRDGRDSALESEDEYTPSFCEILAPDDFESAHSVKNYPIEVPDALVERCATNLSQNERVVSGRRSRDASSASEGKARLRAIQISERDLMKRTLDLLLRRGANPSVSEVPMPVLFFAIKAADVDVVRMLLEKGALTTSRLTEQRGGLAPLHVAVAIPGEEGVIITRLLLEAMSDPNVRAFQDDAFLNTTLEEEWGKDVIEESEQALLGGRTPLQIVCARDDNYEHSCHVVRLLLKHGAKPDLLCNGFSPLALAIASGNDMVIDELLSNGANPSLKLTHGVGSALCVATSTEYEHRRNISQRLGLIDKLVKAGADILCPVLIGPKRMPGTAVDYAYYMFNQDRVIAHMPYHALTYAERETFNCRRRLLAHLGNTLRRKAVEKEKIRKEQEANTDFPDGSPLPHQSDSRVTFKALNKSDHSLGGRETRRSMLKYCYECGRSVGVRLTACTRCKEVYYCSKACKLRAWGSRHKDECVCITNRTNSSKHRDRSPSSKSTALKSKSSSSLTVLTKTKDKKNVKTNLPVKLRNSKVKLERKKVYVDRDGNRVATPDAQGRSDVCQVYVENYSFV